jgi:hypothetical protein
MPFVLKLRVNGKKKTMKNARLKCWQIALAIVAVLSTSLAMAEDFKTFDGKEYKNAIVIRVEPDGIVIRTKVGIAKIYFFELPKDVQEQFRYADLSEVKAHRLARAAEEYRNREKERADQQRIAQAISPKTQEALKTVPAASVLDTNSPGESQAVVAKAQSIRIPYIDFHDVTFREGVEALVQQGQQYDTSGKGVNVRIELNDTSPDTSPIPRITLLLEKPTLFQAVTIVAQQMGLSVRAESYGLVIYRKNE